MEASWSERPCFIFLPMLSSRVKIMLNINKDMLKVSLFLISFLIGGALFAQGANCDGIAQWSNTTAYNGGVQVVQGGNVYQSNWWTQNEDPLTNGGGTNLGDPWTFVDVCSNTNLSTCDDSTPKFPFDLTGNPDSVWTSPQVRRSGLCCDIDPDEKPPARCVEFFFYLDPEAVGIIFDIGSGAVPPGALFYQINCEGRYQFGEVLCLSGPGPYRLTFCKPGNNPNTYIIRSLGLPEVSPPVTVSDGCSAQLGASGYDLSTIEWKSVPSNPVWESYLDCTSLCDTVNVQYQLDAPDSVVYEVCGRPLGNDCVDEDICQQTMVYFVNDKEVVINPTDAMVCYGNSNAVLTANATGGKPPYNYEWSTGETSQSIAVGQGTFSVEVFDQTSCPTAYTEVEVGAFLLPITANAGPDSSYCDDVVSFELQGSVEGALGGVWSGGEGVFSDVTNLNATYSPTEAEKSGGSVTLTLTTTGNRSCPGDNDQVTITFGREPTVIVQNSFVACQNNPGVVISASISDATGVSWESNDGSFLPNTTDWTVLFEGNETAIEGGTAVVTVSTTGNSNCTSSVENITIEYTPKPTLELGPNFSTCGNNPSIELSAVYTMATGVEWFGNGSFSFTNGADTPSYTPTTSEIENTEAIIYAQTTVDNGCLPVSDSVVISFTPSPEILVEDPSVICISDPSINLEALVENGVSVSWSGGSGSFVPSISLNTTYTFGDADKTGDFLELTAATTNDRGCIDEEVSFIINYHPLPTIDIGSDLSICKNNALVPVNAIVSNSLGINWITEGDGVFGNVSSTNTVYTASSDDALFSSIELYAVAFSDGPCLPVLDTLNLNFTDVPIVTSGGSIEACETDDFVALSGGVTSPFGGVWLGGEGTFSPNRTTLNAEYYPTATEVANGQLTLTLQSTNNGTCSPVSDELDITFRRIPTVTFPALIELCADQPTIIDLSASLTNATEGVWSGSEGDFLPDNSAVNVSYMFSTKNKEDSTVTLQFTTTGTAPCPSASSFVTINLTPTPSVDAGGDIFACSRLEPVNISGNVTNADGGIWSSSGTGTFSPSPDLLATTYNPSSADNDVGAVTLTLLTTGNNGCNAYSSTLQLSFVDDPVVNIGSDLTFCSNELPAQLVVQGSPGVWNGLGSFSPNNAVSNPLYTPTASEIADKSFVLSYVTNATALCSSTTVNVDAVIIDGPELSPIADFEICASQNTVSLNTTYQNAGAVSWSSAGFGEIISQTDQTVIEYQLASSEQDKKDTVKIDFIVRTVPDNNCAAISEVITVSVVPINEISVGNDFMVCYTESSINLLVNTNLEENITWSLLSGSGELTGETLLNANYSLEPSSDTILSNLQFEVSTNAQGVCPDVEDILTVEIAQPIRILAPDNIYACEDQTGYELAGQAENYDYVNWTSDGSGSFSHIDELSTSYFLGENDIVGSNIKLFITGIASDGCPNDVDSVLLSISEGVTLDLNSDTTVCNGSFNLNLSANVINAEGVNWSTNGQGVLTKVSEVAFSYELTTLDDDLEPLQFYAETFGNTGCEVQKDTVNVHLEDSPIINLSPDRVCKDVEQITLEGTVQNGSSIVWSSNGGGTFDDNTSFTPVYTLVSSDTTGVDSLLFIANSAGEGVCNPQIDTLVVWFDAIPKLLTEGAMSICIDESSVELSADIGVNASGAWVTTGDGVYTPSRNVVNPTYHFSFQDKQKDSLIFTMSVKDNTSCNEFTEDLIVYFLGYPEIESPTGVICGDGSGTIPLSANVENAVSVEWQSLGSGTFSPSSTDFDVVYSPSVSDLNGTEVTLRLIAEGCVKDSIDFEISLLPGPGVNAGNDDDLCLDNVIPLNGSGINITGVKWSTNGGGSFSSESDLNAIYTPSLVDLLKESVSHYLTSINGNGCPDVVDTVVFNVLDYPSIEGETNLIICSTQDTLDFEQNIIEASLVEWSASGTGYFTPDNTEIEANYVLSDQDKLLSSFQVNVETVPVSCHIAQSKTIQVNVHQPLSIELVPDQEVCTNDVGVNIGANVQGGNGVVWFSDGEGEFDDAFDLNPTYFLASGDFNQSIITMTATTTDVGICAPVQSSLSVAILQAPLVDLGSDRIYCDEIPLVDLSLNLLVANDVEWSSSGTGEFLSPHTSFDNSYQTTEVDTTGVVVIKLAANVNGIGCLNFDSLLIGFEPAPQINIESLTGCEGDTITLIGKPVNITQDSTAIYQWSKNGVVLNNTDSIINVLGPGVYRLEYVLDRCQVEKAATVVMNPSPPSPASFSQVICVDKGDLAEIEISGNYMKYYWAELDDSSKVVGIDSVGVYNFMVFNEYNCVKSGQATVTEACPPEIYVPTIFTPGGSENQLMIVAGINVNEYDLKIFNRWGEIIFQTNDMNEFWDGSYRNEEFPAGVYNWSIRYTGNTEEYYGPYLKKGIITLVR